MFYEGNIIRPPSEADSIILQVTVGCSHNRCTFCGAYKDKRFRIKDEYEIDADIDFAARYCRRSKRVFLADGDALILSQRKLVSILEKIQIHLPWVNRIGTYANAKAIRSKTIPELAQLKSLGLNRIYMGLESGHDEILQKIKKGETAQSMVKAAESVRAAGLFLSVTVLMGIGGVPLSKQHAEATGRALSLMSPRQIAALMLMPLAGTPLYKDMQSGKFHLPNSQGMLRELSFLVQAITLDRVQFHANHASNYLPLSGRLQKDKEKILRALESALIGTTTLVSEKMRAL